MVRRGQRGFRRSGQGVLRLPRRWSGDIRRGWTPPTNVTPWQDVFGVPQLFGKWGIGTQLGAFPSAFAISARAQTPFDTSSIAVAASVSATTTINFNIGDKIVVIGGTEDPVNPILGTPTGGGLSFSPVMAAAGTPGSNCYGRAWHADAASNQTSVTISATNAGSGAGRCGFFVWVLAGHAGLGVSVATVTGSTNTTSLNPTAGSAMLMGMFDWSAGPENVMTGTPTSPVPTEVIDKFITGAYTVGGYDWFNVSAGSQSWGGSGPTGRKWTLVVVEVLKA